MDGLRARQYRDDGEALCALVRKARPAAWVSDYPSANDLREMLREPAVQVNTRVWETANGSVAAYAAVDDFNNLVFDVLPEARSEPLDAEVFAWGIECIQRRNMEASVQETLDAVCRAEDHERTAQLEHFGFVRQPHKTVRMVHPLQAPLPPTRLPNGFHIRTVQGLQEAELLAALHRAAFGTDHMTAEKRAAWMQAPHYDAALDLVVIAPDGSLAASCFGSVDPAANERTGRAEGALDPVATHPAWQRRGLARACLLEGMQRLKERGIEFAVLGTSSENEAMQHAARAAGFQIDSVRVWYSKSVRRLA